MDDERKALADLKRAYRIPDNDDSVSRAPEYDVLKGGHTMFFRMGNGKVVEALGWNSYNSYDEEFLQEALVLRKYTGCTMRRERMQEFLNHSAMKSLFMTGNNNAEKIQGVCAALEALEYSKEWINDYLEPELIRDFD
ncbi:MAG: hypothetical protein IJP92_11905 [Lachnospiraceae bacterium]|nr:hypothetical protein [Lachnospiraceae bacterium]